MELPINIFNLLNNKISNEKVIFENSNFIVIEDLNHKEDNYHYCAWCKNDIRNLLEVTRNTISKIVDIKNNLILKKFIKNDGYIFIHFPPNVWRLHIHFVSKDHIFKAQKYEIFYLDEIEKNLKYGESYYRNNVIIRNKL